MYMYMYMYISALLICKPVFRNDLSSTVEFSK